MAKQNKKEAEELELDQALSKSEQFLIDNRKSLLIGLGVVVALALCILGFNWYRNNRNAEAQEEIASCQQYFANDSINIALNGDGADCIGFLGVIEDYGMTKTGKLAKAYAGICYARLGDNESALEYLKKFSTKEVNANAALLTLIGDTYVNLDETEEGIKYFQKAAETENEAFVPAALYKEGVAYEALGDKENALKAYQQIKDEYPETAIGQDIDKEIERLK